MYVKITEKHKFTISSFLFAIVLFFFILAFSIGLPIYCRPFYYLHIEALNLEETSGFTEDEIKQAFNEVMDYLTIPGMDFSVGVMKYTEDGADHFADCKNLFDLNGGVLIISGLVLLVLIVLRRFDKIKPFYIGQFHASFYSALAAVIIPVVLGGLIAIDFDKAFMIFHKLFFPGKDNWVFDWEADQIIMVLPQEFFMHCAMLIGGGLVCMAVLLIVAGLIDRKYQINHGR